VLAQLVVSMQKNENHSIFIFFYKAQVQVDQDLNIKLDILNLVEEKVEKSLELIGTRKIS
jgi:hypothetical protein